MNQQHSNMQNNSGPSQQMQERHSQLQQSEPVPNARMDNNPKKRMLSQQQHQMVNDRLM